MSKLLKIPRSLVYYHLNNRKKGKSNYTVAQYKVHKKGCNEDNVPNTVNREFKNREIIGYSAGTKKMQT